MENLAVPLIAATVFTAGGYAITRAGKAAEAVGDWLFTVFIATLLVGGAILANQALERRRPAPRADRGLAVPSRAAIPLGQALALLDVPTRFTAATLSVTSKRDPVSARQPG